MTSNFALSLSFEGIRLMHRVPGGWHLVGEVALDSADLRADLADLRASALLLEPDGLRTKLLIPDSQIKYLAIDSARTTQDDVHQALDGATPYAIEDLVIDFDRTGGRTYIAAVARETLSEAESFAADHAFAPISFAATAEPLTFRSEVFFGATSTAEDITGGVPVTRDDIPVKVIGDAVIPGTPEHAPAPILPEFLAPEGKSAEPEDEAETDPAPEADAAAPDPIVAEDPPSDETAAAIEVQEAEDLPDDSDTDATPRDDVPEVMFASRTRAPVAPDPALDPAPAPAPPPEDVAPEPMFTRRKEPPRLAVPTGMVSGPAIDVPAADPPPAPATPVMADPSTSVSAPVIPIDDPMPDAPTSYVETPTPVRAPDPAPERAAPEAATAAVPEQEKMTVFGARSTAKVGGKPKYLALMLMGGLFLFFILVALWANTLTEDGIAGWFRSAPDETEIAVVDPAMAVTAPQIETQPLVSETPAPSALAPETAAPETDDAPQPLPIVRAPTGRVLSPAEADRIYAATGVYQRAPRLPLQPRATSLDGFQEARLLQPGERLAQITIPALDPMLPDATIATPVSPPGPGVEYQRDLRGFIMAMPDGTVTPDGVVIYAGAPAKAPPARPGSEVEAPVLVTTAPVVPALDAETGIILVAGRPPLVPPVRPEGLAPAPTEDATAPVAPPTEDIAPLVLDPAIADAVTAAVAAAAAPATPQPDTAEVALNIVAGAPPRRPPLRPVGFATLGPQDDADATQTAPDPLIDAATPGAVALASFRPAVRPEDATPPAVIFADPALAAFRPAVRPDDLAVVTEAEPETTPEDDINSVLAAIAQAAPESAFENVTARAISASPRPDTRPRNFAQVVARAQANIARRQSQAATVASAPATTRPSVSASAAPAQPSGNVPRTVAQAATVDNAIRLRNMNLIGVYGRPNSRRALVRMGNGRYVKVEVGSSLDGGRVTAIGDSALNFVKRGQTYALQLPQS